MSLGLQIFGGMLIVLLCAYLIVLIWECGREVK